MINRNYWRIRIEKALEVSSIVLLRGPSGSGKTYLCNSLDNIAYFDCELSKTHMLLEDPKLFFGAINGKRVVLDEIHLLPNYSKVLNIASDHYPDIKIIAIGSATPDGFKKLLDSLTVRKTIIHITPMLMHESENLNARFFKGGLPSFFLKDNLEEGSYQEWLSFYWAKIVQELFRVRNRYFFMKFTELLLAHSGNIFEVRRFSDLCEISRATVLRYLSILEDTFIVYIVKPYGKNATKEVVAAAKVYGFDTGFVCHCRGWINLRQEDFDMLWEHMVLNEIIGRGLSDINYWRDRYGHEIDFVLNSRSDFPIAIECKWSVNNFDPKNIKLFRRLYPKGKNYVVANNVDYPYEKDFDGIRVSFVSLEMLVNSI